MKISARNDLKGTIKSINFGPISASLVVEIAPGIEIASVITKESAEHLELAPGKEVHAIVKASSVMIGVD